MQILFPVYRGIELEREREREFWQAEKGRRMLQELTILTSLRLVPPLKRDTNWRKTLLERAKATFRRSIQC